MGPTATPRLGRQGHAQRVEVTVVDASGACLCLLELNLPAASWNVLNLDLVHQSSLVEDLAISDQKQFQKTKHFEVKSVSLVLILAKLKDWPFANTIRNTKLHKCGTNQRKPSVCMITDNTIASYVTDNTIASYGVCITTCAERNILIQCV